MSLFKQLAAAVVAAAAFAGPALASGGGVAWDKFPKDKLADNAALQNGAKLFVNYCLNCHAAASMRYNRMRDIGLSDDQIKANLLFAGEKVGETMTVALNAREAKEWFGAVPPDLSVIARSRAGEGGSGADYLYTYLRGYYRDDTKATGWNNIVFPSVGMPHVLWELQGERRPVFDTPGGGHVAGAEVFTGKWETVRPGAMSAAEYDSAVGDLVAFLQWMGEPNQAQRVRLGVWVMIFLAIFTVIAWRLNAAYWKDVR